MSTCPGVNIQASRSTLSTLSTQSSSLTCRICQDGNSLEALVNACDCSGTIGLVHALCLEKWLSQSARESCELCQYEFKIIKRVKNFYQFVRRPDLPALEKHYILADTACFVVLTPLGLASSYLCLRGANQYYNNDDFWAGFALVLLSTFLTLLYVFWVSIAIRYHYRSFKEWQKESIDIRIVFSDQQHLKVTPKVSELTNNNMSDMNLKGTFQNVILNVRTGNENVVRNGNESVKTGKEDGVVIKKYKEDSAEITTSRKRSVGHVVVGDDPLVGDSLLSTKV